MNILLLSSSPYMPLPILRSQNRKKYSFYLMGTGFKGSSFSKFYKRNFVCKKTPEELVKQINILCEEYDISVIIPVDLSFTLAVSRIKKQLNCPLFPIGEGDDVLTLSDKGAESKLFSELNISQPETKTINSERELTPNILPKPFLIKPTMQEGGKGIKKISTNTDLEVYRNTYSPYKIFPMLAQEYIPGHDIDLNLIAKNGVVLASTVQMWHKDWTLEFIEDDEVVNIGKKIVSHLKYTGLLHIDLRRDAKTGKILVIECNPRSWGTINASVFAGTNFIEIGILSAQDKKIPKSKLKKITYLKPFFMISRVFKSPRSYSTYSEASKRDFINTLTDPVPYILSIAEYLIIKLITKLAVTDGIKKYVENKERLSYLNPIYKV